MPYQFVGLARSHVNALFMAVVLRIDYIMLSGEQVDAVKLGGVVVNACEREERRRNIDERNRIRAPAGGHSGNAQHERDRRRRREHGALAHIAIVAEAFAVIRYKEDRRVVIHTAAAQRVGYAGDLVVNERNAGVIEVFKLQRVEVGYAEADNLQGQNYIPITLSEGGDINFYVIANDNFGPKPTVVTDWTSLSKTDLESLKFDLSGFTDWRFRLTYVEQPLR